MNVVTICTCPAQYHAELSCSCPVQIPRADRTHSEKTCDCPLDFLYAELDRQAATIINLHHEISLLRGELPRPPQTLQEAITKLITDHAEEPMQLPPEALEAIGVCLDCGQMDEGCLCEPILCGCGDEGDHACPGSPL